MNIYAKKGTKVVFKFPENGYPYERKTAEKYLRVGETYTVESVIIDSWVSSVELQEIPNVRFNTVHFAHLVDVSEEQSLTKQNELLRKTCIELTEENIRLNREIDLLRKDGPVGYASWYDAAVAERNRRVSVEEQLKLIKELLDE